MTRTTVLLVGGPEWRGACRRNPLPKRAEPQARAYDAGSLQLQRLLEKPEKLVPDVVVDRHRVSRAGDNPAGDVWEATPPCSNVGAPLEGIFPGRGEVHRNLQLLDDRADAARSVAAERRCAGCSQGGRRAKLGNLRGCQERPTAPMLAPTRRDARRVDKVLGAPQPVTRRMSSSIRAKPTLATLLTNAAPNASAVRPAGVSMTRSSRTLDGRPVPSQIESECRNSIVEESATSGA